MALTDHDNLNGIETAQAEAAKRGIRLISGTELSVEGPTGAIHLLMYFLQPGDGPLQAELSALQRGRDERNRQMVTALQNLGVDITYDEVLAEAAGTGVGRPHFAAVLMAKGVVADIGTAFDRYLASGRPAYQERVRLHAIRAIELARASGAVPVIAHPHTIGVGVEDYERAFRTLADVGLGGIEALYAEYTPELRAHLAAVAAGLGLVATGGSDYHGRYKPDLRIGIGRGDLVVPDETVDQLEAAR